MKPDQQSHDFTWVHTEFAISGLFAVWDSFFGLGSLIGLGEVLDIAEQFKSSHIGPFGAAFVLANPAYQRIFFDSLSRTDFI